MAVEATSVRGASSQSLILHVLTSAIHVDVGNGEYQPAYGQMPAPVGQPNYGATGGYAQ